MVGLRQLGWVNGFKVCKGGKMEIIVPDKNSNLNTLHLSNLARVPRIALNGQGMEVLEVESLELVKLDGHLASDGLVAKLYWREEGWDSKGVFLNVVNKIAVVNDDIKGHVLVLLLFHKFDVFTSNIRKVLGSKIEDDERGSCTLYLLVFCKLQLIWTLLSNSKELLDVWSHCIVCASLTLFLHCHIVLKVGLL